VEKRDVLAFVPLREAFWGVVIRQSEEEALAPARELRLSLLFFGGGLVAIAFLFVAITTRDVINRVGIITTASQKMAEGDLNSPITTLGKDEIGVLAKTFDDMRTKLKISRDELEQMHRDIKRKDEIRGELLQDLFSIQEEERKRIARELHDETSQVIASITAHLEVARNTLPNNVDKVNAIIKKAQTQLIRILEEIHRLIYELRPSLLDDLGLVDGIQWLLDNNLKTAGIVVNFKTTGQVREFDNQLMTALFRVIQEVVYNIVKHAAASNVDVSLRFARSSIIVHIRDDGKGFDVEEAINTKNRPRGLGLIGMMERVELANGILNIRSHHRNGTEIKIEIPLN
jgi:signal transduction histidine kinase